MRSSKFRSREREPRGGSDAGRAALNGAGSAAVLRDPSDSGPATVNERKGWVILTIGIAIFLVFWLGFSLGMYMYGYAFAERILP